MALPDHLNLLFLAKQALVNQVLYFSMWKESSTSTMIWRLEVCIYYHIVGIYIDIFCYQISEGISGWVEGCLKIRRFSAKAERSIHK